MMAFPLLSTAPEGGYVARDPATGTTTQGNDIADALANLREAVGLYLEEFPTPPDPALGPGAH
jgi:predicted RNase H-like HicB family nuclease